MKARRLVMTVLALGLATTVALEARVFMRLGRTRPQHIEAGQSGWSEGVAGAIRINGRDADVQVFSAPASNTAALRRLDSWYRERGADVMVFPSSELGWGLARSAEGTSRFLVVSPRVWNRSLAFLVHTRAGATTPAAVPPLPDIPDYPGARVGSTVERPQQGLTARFLHTTASAQEVLAFYDGALARSGWVPFFSDPAGRRAAGPLAVYVRGNRVCYVSLSDSKRSPSERVVTVLLKTGS